MFETGLFTQMVEKLDKGLLSAIKQETLFNNVKDYIDYYTRIQIIQLDYFLHLFIGLAAFYLLLFFIFLIEICLRKGAKPFKFSLKEYEIILKLNCAFRCPACVFRR